MDLRRKQLFVIILPKNLTQANEIIRILNYHEGSITKATVLNVCTN